MTVQPWVEPRGTDQRTGTELTSFREGVSLRVNHWGRCSAYGRFIVAADRFNSLTTGPLYHGACHDHTNEE